MLWVEREEMHKSISFLHRSVHSSFVSLLQRRVFVHGFLQQRHCSTQEDLETLISSLCENNNARDAFNLLSKIKVRNLSSKLDIYNKVLQALLNTSNIALASKLFDQMKEDVSPNKTTYMSLFNAYCKVARIEEACDLLEEMIVQKGFTLETNVLNLLIGEFVKAGRWKTCRRILFKLCDIGYIPPLVTFNIFFSGLCRSGLMPQACKILDDMINLGFSLDVYTYSIMIHTLCKANKLDEAHRLLKAMRSKRCMPDVVCYSTVLHGYVRLGKPESAMRTMDEMCENGCLPDVVAYNSLLSMFSKQGDTINAYVIWDKMSANGIIPDHISYTSMLDGLCRRNKVKECLKLLREMLKRKLIIDIPLQRKLSECIQRHGIDVETKIMLTEIKENGLDFGITCNC